MMKSTFLYLLLCLSFYSCNGQEKSENTPIGIGILQTNTTYPISLYVNESDKIPVEVLKFKTRKDGTTEFITSLSLRPYVISEGDSYEAGKTHINRGLIRFPPEIKFRVIDSTNNSFKVITNEILNETYYIKLDSLSTYYKTESELYENSCSNCPNSNYNPKWNIFETWERYLIRAEFVTKNELKIYEIPNGKIIFENDNNKFLPFNITEVEGDWIKLRKGFGREFNFENSKNYDGWTQWKDGNKILIDIVEHTYE